jgi:hypothetical protein
MRPWGHWICRVKKACRNRGYAFGGEVAYSTAHGHHVCSRLLKNPLNLSIIDILLALHLISLYSSIEYITEQVIDQPQPTHNRYYKEIYAVNPGYPRALKSSTDSATTSFRGVAVVNPSSSSAFFVSKLMLNEMPFVDPGSPRGTFGIPSSAAKSTCFPSYPSGFRTKRRN